MPSQEGPSEGGESLPPSCRYVLHVLQEAGGELTRQQLIDCTGMPPSTLDDALQTLESRHSIHRARKSDDLTQVVIETRQSPEV